MAYKDLQNSNHGRRGAIQNRHDKIYEVLTRLNESHNQLLKELQGVKSSTQANISSLGNRVLVAKVKSETNIPL